ncbi:MAG TPA: carboxypeptidase regulatory-like domain-containing protein [Pyrinomonadaceae bacterium]|nr:carboxypeptidase regulatory-like domain-containing protein [Pyrinomonadaceae bacterium]
MLIRVLFGAVLFCSVASSALGQQTTGALKGTVTDQLGSLVVGAKVTLRNARGVSTTANTNSAGVYEFRRVEAGKYELRIDSPGFTVFEDKAVEIQARDLKTLNVQLEVALEDQQVTVDDRNISTDSDNNQNAIVLRGRELEALPNDPQALAQALQAMAGPTDPEAGGNAQIKVDGFSNGQIPPKEAIREVRINNNPFSAENEFPGWNGIEIFTQPGADKWHGSFSFDFNDESLNSRNPFTTRRAPYQQRAYNFSISGPIIPKRASFSIYFGRYASDANSVVNATIIDPVTLKQVVVNESFVTPDVNNYGNGRFDFKINKVHTIVGRFNYNRTTQDLQGIGGYSLPTRAYRGMRDYLVVQLTETALINEKTVNETRFQFTSGKNRQTSLLDAFALNVLDSFNGGGSQVGSTSNRTDRFELTNFTSWTHGNHFLKVGGRLRHVKVDSVSPGNFGGTWTFGGGPGPRLDENDQVVLIDNKPVIDELSSLERYRRTLAFARAEMSPAAIRLLGGGATQFSIAGGDPEALVKQTDVAVYMQDEWKVRPNFTLSPGFRYENQSNIDSNYNFAPRIAFAWSPVFGKKKTATTPAPKPATTPAAGATAAASPAPAAPATPAPAGPPKTVFRGGLGIFYWRTSEDITLAATRFDGTNQQQFLVTNPLVLDLFPVVPPIEALDAFALPQIRRVKSDDLQTGRNVRFMFTVERSLPANVKLSFTYMHSRATRTQRVVNINAPLGGTFIPGVPNSGVRPLGADAGNILQYQSTGRALSNTLSVNINGTVKKVQFWGGYNLNKSRSTDGGQSGSTSDAYDFSHEYARSPFGSLNFLYGGGSYAAPGGINLNMFMIANSGYPFNITTGRDTNGDTFFSERPAFASDLSEPGVIVTPLGAFDPTPSAGQTIIPRNFGRGPGFVSVNMSMGKTFKFGKAIEPQAPPPGAPKTTDATKDQKAPAKQPVQRPYAITFSINATNIFNRTNKGNPVGNMTSPFFLKSPSGSNNFSFGPGGGSGGNRVINLRVRFSF